MATERRTIWSTLYNDVTSEDKFNTVNGGRWAGYLDIPCGLADFKGDLWVIDSTGASTQFGDFPQAAEFIGWNWEENSEKTRIRGVFDTSTGSANSQFNLFQIDATVEASAIWTPDYYYRSEVDNLLSSAHTEMLKAVDDKVHVTGWNIGKYTVNANTRNNLMAGDPISVDGDPVFARLNSGQAASVQLVTGIKPYGRIVKFTHTADITPPAVDDVSFQFSLCHGTSGAVLSQTWYRLGRLDAVDGKVQVAQFDATVYIRANTYHPILNEGVRPSVTCVGSGGPIVVNPGFLSAMVINS